MSYLRTSYARSIKVWARPAMSRVETLHSSIVPQRVGMDVFPNGS
jgi:hypothetical protein